MRPIGPWTGEKPQWDDLRPVQPQYPLGALAPRSTCRITTLRSPDFPAAAAVHTFLSWVLFLKVRGTAIIRVQGNPPGCFQSRSPCREAKRGRESFPDNSGPK